MPYMNLKAEMRRRKLTQKDIADALKMGVSTAKSKINGRGDFSLSEALAIRKAYFPELEISYLFVREEPSLQN